MRLVRLNDLQGTETLGRTVFDAEGRRLLNRGVMLSPSVLQRFQEKGIQSLYIDDLISEGIEINDALSEETRLKARSVCRDEMERLRQKKDIQLDRLSSAADSILDELLRSRINLISGCDMRMDDDVLFAHAVNVAMLSTILATKLDFPPAKIKSIALGALLHDIGKSLVPPEILSKAKMTQDEQQEFERHPVYGYNLIKDSNDITATTKITILMHHEWINGAGYPLKLAGDKIHYSARIAAICDAYDTQLNGNERSACTFTSEAIEFLVGASGHFFDHGFVQEFIKMIPIFPEGSLVMLSDGWVAIVVQNGSGNLSRPIIRLLFHSKDGRKASPGFFIDLQRELSLKIVREMRVSTKDMPV